MSSSATASARVHVSILRSDKPVTTEMSSTSGGSSRSRRSRSRCRRSSRPRCRRTCANASKPIQPLPPPPSPPSHRESESRDAINARFRTASGSARSAMLSDNWMRRANIFLESHVCARSTHKHAHARDGIRACARARAL